MRRAFTLIEVLVALGIFGLAAVVLGSAYVNVLNAYEQAQKINQTDQDLRFARAQLLAEPDRDKAEKGDDFDAGNGRHIRWHATIDSTNISDVHTVTFICELSSSTGGALPTVTETFTLLRPTWSDPVVTAKLRQDSIDRIKELQGQKQ